MLFFIFTYAFCSLPEDLSLTFRPRPLQGLKIHFYCVYKTIGETFGRALSAHSQTFLVSQPPLHPIQSKPLIPLQKEEDPESHKTVLTNYMFPQQTRTEDCE